MPNPCDDCPDNDLPFTRAPFNLKNLVDLLEIINHLSKRQPTTIYEAVAIFLCIRHELTKFEKTHKSTFEDYFKSFGFKGD